MINKIINELKEIGTTHAKEFAESLIPNCNNMIGVKIPVLRSIAKRIAKENPIMFLEQNDFSYYELEMLQAMVIGYMKTDIKTKLTFARIFIPFIHDWSVNDTFCQTFKDAVIYQEDVWNLLGEYYNSTNEFELRVVVIMMMCYFINDEYVDKVIDFITNTYLDKYYFKMGVAWCMQVIMMKYPDKGLNIIKSNSLDKWTHNKAISKMTDSFRISAELKTELKKYRRK